MSINLTFLFLDMAENAGTFLDRFQREEIQNE